MSFFSRTLTISKLRFIQKVFFLKIKSHIEIDVQTRRTIAQKISQFEQTILKLSEILFYIKIPAYRKNVFLKILFKFLDIDENINS